MTSLLKKKSSNGAATMETPKVRQAETDSAREEEQELHQLLQLSCISEGT
jgi:hypothetical protein